MKVKLNRRTFLKTSSAIVAPTIVPATVFGTDAKPAANDRLALGLIGAGGKGLDRMTDFKRTCDEVQFIAVADPDEVHANKGKALAEKLFGEGCKTYRDFRALCARKDIDAIVVATPDHWHAITCLEAIRSGKDVYGESRSRIVFTRGMFSTVRLRNISGFFRSDRSSDRTRFSEKRSR